jgi:Fe-S oxidoreductase
VYELQFNEDLCASCSTGDCLANCQYMKVQGDRASIEIQKIFRGEDSFVLWNCVTCYACEEYCKRGNHPFYLITQRREDKSIQTAPRAVIRQWINIGEPRGKADIGEIRERALSFGFMPQLRNIVRGRLFEHLLPSAFFGQEFFCNAVYLHFGDTHIFKKRLPEVIRNIADLGAKEVVFLHDECYAAFSSLAPAFGMDVPFDCIHYFDYLYERLQELQDRISPLGFRAAYQRPCSNRLCPQTHLTLDKILSLIGVERVERKYRDENALCCGSIFRSMYGYDLFTDVQTRNVQDMAAAGAEICLFNCHGCQNALSEKVSARGIRPMHLVELCRLAIGEETGTEGA